jgi:hypothetical protein
MAQSRRRRIIATLAAAGVLILTHSSTDAQQNPPAPPAQKTETSVSQHRPCLLTNDIGTTTFHIVIPDGDQSYPWGNVSTGVKLRCSDSILYKVFPSGEVKFHRYAPVPGKE